MSGFRESGMLFIPPSDNDEIFAIEQSRLYKSLGDGIKTVEFILRKGLEELDFIEAKSGTPITDRQSAALNTFLKEVTEKFTHSFNLYCAAILGRYEEQNDMNDSFKTLDYSKLKFKFLLVIKGHQPDWLSPLKTKLEQELSYHRKIWKSECIVLNDEMAKKYHIVSDEG
ncbi:hypothetical protein FACS1894167_06860 [Synergistales bacterium]|nr:hypothetical protein FACS1894167_06860 [Synergistales bacterium]